MKNKMENTPKKEKTKTERKAQKVLYVSPEHHLEAKKAALLKGFSKFYQNETMLW